MKAVKRFLPIILIILACVLSHLPQLLSPNLMLDGDECILTMMARYIYEGRQCDLFYIGQQYGLSIFETLPIALYYVLFGISTLSVKLAMLSLWTCGVILFYKVLCLLNGNNSKWIPIILTLIFISSPAWGIWAMKARGGYITAFVFAQLVLYMMFNEKLNKRPGTGIWLGLFTVIVCFAHSLFLLGLVPFILYRLMVNKDLKQAIAFIASFSLLYIAIHFYTLTLSSSHINGASTPASWQEWQNRINNIDPFISTNLHGHYYLSFTQATDRFSLIFAGVFSKVIYALLILAIVSLFFKRKSMWLFRISAISIILTLCGSLVIDIVVARYLLPLLGWAILSLQLLLNESKPARRLALLGIPLIINNCIALTSFYDYSFCTVKPGELEKLAQELRSKNIQYAICESSFLSWQLIFYSNEKIICRSKKMKDRYQPYVDRVNKAFDEHEKTAVLVDNAPYYFSFDKTDYPNRHDLGHFSFFTDVPKEALYASFDMGQKKN